MDKSVQGEDKMFENVILENITSQGKSEDEEKIVKEHSESE